MATYYLSAFADEASSDLKGQIAALKRNRIRFIELRGTEFGPVDFWSDATCRSVKDILDSEGIGVSALGSRLGKTPTDQSFGTSFESARRLCEICHMMGTDKIRMFSYYMPEGKTREDVREEVMERLEKLCELGKEYGVRMMHENEAKIYGENLEQVLDVHKSVPALGGIFDPSNYRRAGVDQALTIKTMIPYIDYIHIKDCTNEREIVPSGYGDALIGETIAAHNEVFEGVSYLTLEPHLGKFQGYSEIDKSELKNKFCFKDSDEAFDFAATSLKAVLNKFGFHESEDMAWTK